MDLALRVPLGWVSFGASAFVVLLALGLRGRLYAIFATVLLSIHSGISQAVFPYSGLLAPLFLLLQLAVFAHFLSLIRARLRPTWFRLGVSVPASAFVAGTFLALPWAVAIGFGATPHAVALPYGLALIGVFQSLWMRRRTVDIEVDDGSVAVLARHPHGGTRSSRALQLVQITDPHLGPFMTKERLRRICERAVQAAPDLILLTGDFITMESHHAEHELTYALAPLAAMKGKVFACRGNHDYEAPRTIENALAAAQIPFLLDDAVVVETAAGPVQILGLDFHFTDRKARLEEACAKHPRVAGAFRLVLLHDPGAFKYVPEGDADLVLSGHTHGGQLGLVSLGLKGTFVSLFTKIPDHGYWALGTNRMYVHRGTGHYGFPLRIGVPGEEGVLRVHSARLDPVVSEL